MPLSPRPAPAPDDRRLRLPAMPWLEVVGFLVLIALASSQGT